MVGTLVFRVYGFLVVILCLLAVLGGVTKLREWEPGKIWRPYRDTLESLFIVIVVFGWVIWAVTRGWN